MIILDEPKKCKKCQKFLTQQGEVWVCEDCGPEEVVAAPVDAGAAQAAVNDAAAVTPPVTPVTPPTELPAQ